MPSVYCGTPHPYPFISKGFCYSLANLYMPFPDYLWEPVAARFIPDARNAIVANAKDRDFDLTMQIDADQYFKWDFFIKLFKGLEGQEDDTIVTGWSICKTGIFENKPSLFQLRDDGGGVYAMSEAEIEAQPEYFPVHSFGSCGFLAYTRVFEKLGHPYFADLNFISGEGEGPDIIKATSFAVGQDILFGARAREAGIKLIACKSARMPHEVVRSI